jgi:hypothetical protein
MLCARYPRTGAERPIPADRGYATFHEKTSYQQIPAQSQNSSTRRVTELTGVMLLLASYIQDIPLENAAPIVLLPVST